MVQLRGGGAYCGPAERGVLTVFQLREGELTVVRLREGGCTRQTGQYNEAGMCKMEARKKCPVITHLASSVRNLIEGKTVSSMFDIGNLMLSSC